MKASSESTIATFLVLSSLLHRTVISLQKVLDGS